MPHSILAEDISTQHSGPKPQRITALTLLRLAKGRTIWSVEGQMRELREEQVLILLPGQGFGGIESSESVPIRIERVDLELPGNKLSAKSLSACLSLKPEDAGLLVEALRDLPNPVVSLNGESGKLFGDIIQHAPHTTPMARLHTRSCLLHLLTRLCLALKEQDATIPSQSEAELAVARFLGELEGRCTEEWTLDGMAECAGLKRSRFGVLCRRLTGESPTTYLNRLRIRRSRQLLRETDDTVTNIAFDCGFGSSQYFAKIFRRFQGHEPTHYRLIAREIRRGEGIHYLKGDSARVVAFAEREVGPGDFKVEGELTLDRLGDTAASLEFGRDRFGFDGREGRFFLEGETFGNAQVYQRSADVIREGIPFRFKLARKGKQLRMSVEGITIAALTDSPKRPIGKVGLRPLRNGVHVRDFRIDGEHVVLEGVSAT